ncbi:MAG: thiamine phosphate synthase [Helicobacteraceae bacterium]|nr:thiamine phosphate synthase [Helicobacteraceae bacterium]
MLQGIYAISDELLTPQNRIKEMLKEAIKGGISLFQLRDKTTQDSSLLPLCAELMQICSDFKVTFILNDRIDLAIKLNAPGLHIGTKENGIPYSLNELKEIRKNFSGILGISCYGDISLAQSAQSIGADYIAFGSCFKSPTKQEAKTISLNLFKIPLRIPKCAIGGITKENITSLKNAEMIACISSIWRGDIAQNIKDLKKAWKY